MIKNAKTEVPFYYPNDQSPMLFIFDEGTVNTYYAPTQDTLLQIEEEFGVNANELQEFLWKMPPGSHTLVVDVEAYLKAKKPSETDILNEKIDKLLQENFDLRQELRKMERSTRADILRRIARQLKEEADQVKPLLDED